MKALWRETSKQSLLSHAEYLQSLIDDRAKAELAENWTAVSSFQRLIGQAIGSLSENHVFTERPDTADLVKRIAGTDPGLAERLTRALDGRKDFDA
jgi:hypothetical protein